MSNKNYYDFSTDEYINGTINADISSIYKKFLHYLAPSSSILDAGCGSGRDMLYFKNAGYHVEGFDNSINMVEKASQYSGCKVRHLSFEDLEIGNKVDAIWACASLLHVTRENLEKVFQNLYRTLHKEGIFYCSFKNKDVDFEEDGRYFTCFTLMSFQKFIEKTNLFIIKELFLSEDARGDRKGEMWVNAILQAV